MIPEQHAHFFSGLLYLGLGTLDVEGRSWATLLCTPAMIARAEDELTARGVLFQSNPFTASLRALRLIAGVVIDFNNRRRNKLNGYVTAAAGPQRRGEHGQ